MMVLRGEALLYALDCALDDAAEHGRIRRTRPDPDTRALTRRLRAMDAPREFPPRPKPPVQTALLVMDRATRRRLTEACRVGDPGAWGQQVVTYQGIPIKVDDDAAGRIYIVSLHPMAEVA